MGDLLCCAMSGVLSARRRTDRRKEGGEMACARGSPGHYKRRTSLKGKGRTSDEWTSV